MNLIEVRAVDRIEMREGESQSALNARLSEFHGEVIAVAESRTRKDGHKRIAHCGFKTAHDKDAFALAFHPDTP